jgi:prepilin-type N-terminal cleavage/methylation domain-containing protein
MVTVKGKSGEKRKGGESGFTLVELMITIVIMLIVLGILIGIIAGVQSEYKVQRIRMEAINSAQTAQDNISRILRDGGNEGNSMRQHFSSRSIDSGCSKRRRKLQFASGTGGLESG